MISLDQELCEISALLSKYSAHISCLEELQKIQDFCCSRNFYKCGKVCKTDWHIFSELLMRTDAEMMNNSNLLNDAMDLINCAELQPRNPYNMVSFPHILFCL